MDRSEVMQNLQHLSDVIGPRLSGLSGHAAGQRLDRRAVQGLRPHRDAGALHFGVTWERGSASAAADRAVHPGRHRPQLGLDRGDRGKTLDRAGGPHRSLHSGEPRGIQGQGEGRLGASSGAVPDLESRWAGDDGRRTRAELEEQMRAPRQLTADTSAAAVAARRQFSAGPALHAQGGRRARHPDRRLQGARAHDHERLTHPSGAAAQSGHLP